MPFVTADSQQSQYDVIVVGSGAGGGQSAYTLCMDGAKVLMLEAGRNYSPTESSMFRTPDLAPLAGVGTPDKPSGFFDATVDGGWNVPGEPYVRETEEDAGRFEWWRARMLGGRTNHWGRISLRNGPYDFKPRRRDGLGFDWPIDYADVAPYYDKVELLVGVYGTNEGLENTPNSSPGCLLPPPKPIVSDYLVRERGKRLGIPAIPGHRAVLTRALDYKRSPARLHPGNAKAQKILAEDMRSRTPCLWATPCGYGCAVRANYQSTTVHLPPALKTGNLDITTDAMVYEVTLGKDGRADGVNFIDRTTGKQRHASARVVILAASACETVRILLNSRSPQFPGGLANSSGKLGRYLMDTVGSTVGGQIPLLESLPPLNEDAAGGHQLYVPWWLYQEQLAGKLGFARGYHIEFGGGKRMPGYGTAAGIEWLTGGSYGAKFKQDVRRYYGSFVWFDGRGEMIPNEQSYCEIDSKVKDKWGIPVLRFHWQWSDNEIKMAKDMQETFRSIVETAGGTFISKAKPDGSHPYGIADGGVIIHELGTVRMGNNAKTSALNKNCQAHDVKNVFVTDAAAFVTNPDKNPTLTIMALSWRASEYLLGQAKSGSL